MPSSWYRFKVRTLEEAEQEMEGGLHARQAMAHSRLAALVANGEQHLTGSMLGSCRQAAEILHRVPWQLHASAFRDTLEVTGL